MKITGRIYTGILISMTYFWIDNIVEENQKAFEAILRRQKNALLT